MVLVCASLIISDVEQLFVHKLLICVSSLETRLFRPLAHFLIGSFYVFIVILFAVQLCEFLVHPGFKPPIA